jgi:hypothetical protein
MAALSDGTPQRKSHQIHVFAKIILDSWEFLHGPFMLHITGMGCTHWFDNQ